MALPLGENNTKFKINEWIFHIKRIFCLTVNISCSMGCESINWQLFSKCAFWLQSQSVLSRNTIYGSMLWDRTCILLGTGLAVPDAVVQVDLLSDQRGTGQGRQVAVAELPVELSAADRIPLLHVDRCRKT